VVLQQAGVRLAVLIQQAGRSLDVGEEEGDGSGWELAHLAMILR
jgi:hypothetical protein